MLVCSARHVLDPGRIGKIPLDRLSQPSLKALLGPPPQFSLNLSCVNRISAIVSRPVFNKGDELRVRAKLRLRNQLIKQTAQRLYDFKIAALISSANVVRLPHPAVFEHSLKRTAMIKHKQPVTNLLAIPVNRQRLTFESIRNH